MKRAYVTCSRAIVALWAALGFAHLMSKASAQSLNGSVALPATEFAVMRLAPDVHSGAVPLQIDAPAQGRIMVRISSTIGGVSAWIVTPTQLPINPSTAINFGGTYLAFEGSGTPQGPTVLPLTDPGFHSIYDFPSQGPGVYVVHCQGPTSISAEVAVVVECLTQSSVGAHLVISDSTVTLYVFTVDS